MSAGVEGLNEERILSASFGLPEQTHRQLVLLAGGQAGDLALRGDALKRSKSSVIRDAVGTLASLVVLADGHPLYVVARQNQQMDLYLDWFNENLGSTERSRLSHTLIP